MRSYSMEVYSSRQSCVPEMQQPSSPEVFHRGMHGIRYQMYKESAVHPEYPVHQKYLSCILPADGNCWYNTEYLLCFRLYGYPASAYGHVLQDDMCVRTSFVNFCVRGSLMSQPSHFAFRPASFMPTRPMVEK